MPMIEVTVNDRLGKKVSKGIVDPSDVNSIPILGNNSNQLGNWYWVD